MIQYNVIQIQIIIIKSNININNYYKMPYTIFNIYYVSYSSYLFKFLIL